MTMIFPLPAADFFGGLPVVEAVFYAPAHLSMARTRGGAVTTATRGVRLWTGTLTLDRQRHADAAGTAALISVLSEAGRTFFAHPMPRYTPIADPTGALLGSATPLIHTLASAREMRIQGLPAGYVLTRGDHLGFAYGASPTRYALHQIVTGGTADGSGITPLIEVTPPIRPGAETGAEVQLIRPTIKAILIPGAGGKSRRVFTDAVTVEFIQTLG